MEAKYDDEKITGVAIRINGTFISLRPPYRHNSLFPVLSYLGYNPPYNDEQGFVTSKGRFVTREEAWKIADAAGQILYRSAGYDNGVLFSENLW